MLRTLSLALARPLLSSKLYSNTKWFFFNFKVPVTAFLRCHKRTFRTRKSCSLVVSMIESQWWRVGRTALLFGSVLSAPNTSQYERFKIAVRDFMSSVVSINDVQRMKLRVSLANRNPRFHVKSEE